MYYIVLYHIQTQRKIVITFTTKLTQIETSDAYLCLPQQGLEFWSHYRNDLKLSICRPMRYYFPFLSIYPFHLRVQAPKIAVSGWKDPLYRVRGGSSPFSESILPLRWNYCGLRLTSLHSTIKCHFLPRNPMTYWKLGFFPKEKRSLSINMVTLLDTQINVKREFALESG